MAEFPHDIIGAVEAAKAANNNLQRLVAEELFARQRLVNFQRAVVEQLSLLTRELPLEEPEVAMGALVTVAEETGGQAFARSIGPAADKLSQLLPGKDSAHFAYVDGQVVKLSPQEPVARLALRVFNGPELDIGFMAVPEDSTSNHEVELRADTPTDPDVICDLMRRETVNDPPWQRLVELSRGFSTLNDPEAAERTHKLAVAAASARANVLLSARRTADSDLGHIVAFLNYLPEHHHTRDEIVKRWAIVIAADEDYPARKIIHEREIAVLASDIYKDTWHSLTKSEQLACVLELKATILRQKPLPSAEQL